MTTVVSSRRFTSIYDQSPDWRDWFSAAEYENPWDASSPRLKPLDFAPADYATKHIIHLLQQFHNSSSSSSSSNTLINRVTTEQCNSALKNLLDLLPPLNSNKRESSSLKETDTAIRTQRIAERADAILENMELVDDVLTATSQQNDSNQEPSISSPNHQKRLPRLPPKPNRDTYNTVLQIFSRTAGSRKVPQRAAEIVERMELRYAQRHELELKPVNFHWNCVLLAWKNCIDDDDWEKPVHAIRLILEKAAQDPNLVDNSSYIHLLRICALHHHHHNQQSQGSNSAAAAATSLKASKLGASVAVKLWQELFERDGGNALPVTGELQSHFYSHFLQAIRALDAGILRQTYYAAAFQRAVDHGKVNRFVLQEFFLHVQDPKVFDRFLGPYRGAVAGMKANEAVQTILELVPPEWTRHAEGMDHSKRDDSKDAILQDENRMAPTNSTNNERR